MTQEAINKENADREHEPKQDFIMNADERHLNRQVIMYNVWRIMCGEFWEMKPGDNREW